MTVNENLNAWKLRVCSYDMFVCIGFQQVIFLGKK